MNNSYTNGPNNRDLAKALSMLHGNLFETEWMGTVITVKVSSKRYELSIDGITQDFYEGYSHPEVLRGRNKAGDKIEVKITSRFIFGTKFEFYFNGKYIYSAEKGL